MKFIFSQKGVSILETMVAIGLLGIGVYFMVGALKTGSMGQKALQAQDDARVLTDNMAAIISDPVACENTFAGIPSSPNSAKVNPSVDHQDVQNIVDANMKVQFTTGKIYGNRSLKLKSITIGGTGIDGKTQIQKWSPTSNLAPGAPQTGMANVQVVWQQTGNVGSQSGPQELSRFFMVYVAKLDSTNTYILNCTAQAGGAAGGSDSQWSLAKNGNDIYNTNNSGLGNVGIGTSAPTNTLHVYSSVQANGMTIDGTASPGMQLAISGSQKGALGVVSKAGDYASLSAVNDIVLRSAGGALIFDTNNGTGPAPALRIDGSNGNVGIGISSGGPQQKLDVAGSIQAQAFLYSSDARLKKDIQSIDGYDLARKLEGVSFTWRNNGQRDIGLIAQEVEKVAPELVVTGANGLKAVKYGNITAILVEAFKSQDQRVEVLEQENQELVRKVHELDMRMNRLMKK